MSENYMDMCMEAFEKYLGEDFFDSSYLDIIELYECYKKYATDIGWDITKKYKIAHDEVLEYLGNFWVNIYTIEPTLLEQIAKVDKGRTRSSLFSGSSLPLFIIMPNCRVLDSEFIFYAKNVKLLNLSLIDPKFNISPRILAAPLSIDKVIFNPDYKTKNIFTNNVGYHDANVKYIEYQGKHYTSFDELNKQILKDDDKLQEYWWRIGDSYETLITKYSSRIHGNYARLKKNMGLQASDCPVYFKTMQEAEDCITSLYSNNSYYLKLVHKARIDQQTAQSGLRKVKIFDYSGTKSFDAYVQGWRALHCEVTDPTVYKV